LTVSNFYCKQNAENELEFNNSLLSIYDYIKYFNNQCFTDNLKTINIITKAVYLNELFQSYSIIEIVRCTLVSGILVALLNESFRNSYGSTDNTDELSKLMLLSITTTFTKANIRKKDEMLREYEKILNEPIVRQAMIKHRDEDVPKETIIVFKEIIQYLQQYVYPLVNMEDSGYDVLGRFYTEFIRYAGTEQAQGLVLTPWHITDLFCDLGKITKNSVVYDPCCGSAGFLNSAMKRMIDLSLSDSKQINNVKKSQLIGVELRPSMFTYAVTNMMMRGDGKSNVYRDDCFVVKDEIISKHHPNLSFLNPPYDVGTAGQLKFIEHSLDVVGPENGIVVAIVQMSACIKNEKELLAVKKRILEKHTLSAVISMPDDLFYPVGVVTAIMVFESNRAHGALDTWFGYMKDDGFEKIKHQGRVNKKNRWKTIKDQLTNAYLNRREVEGISVLKKVGYSDEWCCEAYMPTNYSVLNHTLFVEKIKRHVLYKIANEIKVSGVIGQALNIVDPIDLSVERWRTYKYSEVFDIKKGYYNKKPIESSDKDIPFVGASDFNNGITSWHLRDEVINTSKIGDEDNTIDGKLFEKFCITVTNNGSVGCAFFQELEFTCSHDVNPLYLKEKELNVYIALFLCVLIELEKFRWAYGRKWRPVRMPTSTIKLPTNDDGTIDYV
jgi:type I restriction enzyme M protein